MFELLTHGPTELPSVMVRVLPNYEVDTGEYLEPSLEKGTKCLAKCASMM